MRNIIWENGLGELKEGSMIKVQLNDNKWYWEVETYDVDDVVHTFVIGQDRNVSEV